ncbi:MAG: hypothetical protein NT169_18710 [Chloroflexi bacterium]|nr:hypothetical protein [Chloroflexota bacterium]
MIRVARILKLWLVSAVIVTCLAGLVYVVGQQLLRQTANDPQIQMAEDAGRALAGGQSLQAIVPANKIEIDKSLAPFLIAFDGSGQPVASSVTLDGQTPQVPAGVFAYTRQHGQDRLTWQPRPGVRIAAVVVYYVGSQPGFVLAGRSLREVEQRENNVLALAAAGGLATLLAALVAIAALESLLPGDRGHGPA